MIEKETLGGAITFQGVVDAMSFYRVCRQSTSPSASINSSPPTGMRVKIQNLPSFTSIAEIDKLSYFNITRYSLDNQAEYLQSLGGTVPAASKVDFPLPRTGVS